LSQNVEEFVYVRTPRMVGFNGSPDGINDVFETEVERGSEIVFLNGLMLREGDDYTKPMISSFGLPLEITFNSAPAATDKIDVYGVPLGTVFNGTDDPDDGGLAEAGSGNSAPAATIPVGEAKASEKGDDPAKAGAE